MKKIIKFICVYLIFVLSPTVLPAFAAEDTYRVGIAQEMMEGAENIQKAFEEAAARFSDWMYDGVPNGYVTREGDHYMQTFADGEDRAAAIYVTPEHKGYLLHGPIYEQYESVGGDAVLGAPASDPFQVNGTWYQNFRNGHVEVMGDTGKATFVEGRYVSQTGETMTDLPEERVTTDSEMGNSISSMVSDMASNVKSNVEKTGEAIKDAAPGWVAWLVIIALAAAALIIGVMCYKKKKR